jgi:hypothetical protein
MLRQRSVATADRIPAVVTPAKAKPLLRPFKGSGRIRKRACNLERLVRSSGSA